MTTKTKIYLVNGVGGAGKDTFVDFVRHYVPVLKVSSIDAVKDIAKGMGWNGEKDEKGRAFLSALKNAWTAYNDGPLLGMKNIIRHDLERAAIFIMVREFDEMIKMQNMFGGQTLIVVNNTVIPGETEIAFLNQVPDDYKYDIVIKNNGSLADLDRIANQFAKYEILNGADQS